MTDLVLFPHCDLHTALNGTPPLTLRVFLRDTDPTDQRRFALTDVTNSCVFEFLAPYQTVGSRLAGLPSVDPATGRVTANATGIFLLQVRDGARYQVARLQVHDRVLGWWFGNSSITTARDDRFAHAQPSIYALFSDDPSGTDLVGDITGHGYVALTSRDPAVFAVNPDGRLRGVVEGNSQLDGSFLAVNHSLPVRVVDYARSRAVLDSVRVQDLARTAEMHNVLFVAEGFRDTAEDRATFDEVVTEVVDEMFSKPRHAPYNLLVGSFNIWKAYEPSAQHTVTCGFRINDEEAPGILAPGFPVPYEGSVSADPNVYPVDQLVRRVGLPLRGENRTRAELLGAWGGQSLTDLDPTKVDDNLVAAWKKQRSLGLLEARDTFLGLRLGTRLADRISGFATPAVPAPPADAPGEPMRRFVARLYEFFTVEVSRALLPDPRRHPPELLANPWNDANSDSAIMRYVGSLSWRFAPHPNIGQNWVPDPADAVFKPSRGLVAVIVNDGVTGGANICASTMTAITLAKLSNVSFAYTNTGNERVLRRTPPDQIPTDVDEIINTVAHEFGHSFNLADEYEELPGDYPDAKFQQDFAADNASRLGAIYRNGTVQPDGTVVFINDEIDPARVKWFDLVRIRLSAALLRDSADDGTAIMVTIDRRFMPHWTAAKRAGTEVSLRAPDLTPLGRQLPLNFDNAHQLTRLSLGNIDEAAGTILLTGPGLPPRPFPVFPAGSVLYVPRRNAAGEPVNVVEKKVRDKIASSHLPLNQDTRTDNVNREPDSPVDIADFKPPCKSYKLIGVYEGATHWAGHSYRPAGLCKMRTSTDVGTGDGEFCHVCKWLIVNRVDAGRHDLLDQLYPEAKKNG